jgi:hypothetical protein
MRWLIMALNFLGGLTGFGWVVALIWSMHAIHKSPLTERGLGTDGGESGLNIATNDSVQLVDAPDKSEQISRLAALLQDGSITAEEFQQLKAEVMVR